ncbi:DUF2271 domain-containing protein [Salinimonas sp. HHU 13199]|uniref:DUF2271 domain-containing protein n=1 Tax=Salinimonas profundi TaxID=2729140 RepID=A0ABR8LL32_9ALTE|nr:PepSY-associated TM helix domain-containing protein [Salinimonas profundi]MBD3586283.1 DUF2271 domain-containing protein [Salinimonas profundi]
MTTKRRRSKWWDLRTWHWISSAICLAGLLLFAVTGITLNHASSIESQPVVTSVEKTLPDALIKTVKRARNGDTLPRGFSRWMTDNTNVDPGLFRLQWSDYELYGSRAGPGENSWFSVDLESGTVSYESTARGMVAFFNDLHKGRNTGFWWKMFIDAFSIATLLFSLTGLWLLKRYARGRASTWPLVIAGVGIPALLLIMSTAAHAASGKLSVTTPRQQVAEYHNPYLAIWLADARHTKVMNIKVMYDVAMDNDKGEKWLKDLRLWWRRSGRSTALPVDGVTGATRPSGTMSISLSGHMQDLASLEAGEYFIFVEAARELGGRELVKLPLTLPLTAPLTVTRSGNHELGNITLTMEP